MQSQLQKPLIFGKNVALTNLAVLKLIISLIIPLNTLLVFSTRGILGKNIEIDVLKSRS